MVSSFTISILKFIPSMSRYEEENITPINAPSFACLHFSFSYHLNGGFPTCFFFFPFFDTFIRCYIFRTSIDPALVCMYATHGYFFRPCPPIPVFYYLTGPPPVLLGYPSLDVMIYLPIYPHSVILIWYHLIFVQYKIFSFLTMKIFTSDIHLKMPYHL